MTIAFWCVLAAGWLPIVATGIAKSGRRYDNRNPREWLQKQEGYRKRANAAQKNLFEGLPFFVSAVIIAYVLHAPQKTIDLLALLFIAARIAYLACYVADWASLRSWCWFIGMGAVTAMFIVAA
jgi:uncharacterized MAPEG superfamily protein